jgi:N-glycosylase/DNA lyase
MRKMQIKKTGKYEYLVEYIEKHQDDFYRLAYLRLHQQEASLRIVQIIVDLALNNYRLVGKSENYDEWFCKVITEKCIDQTAGRTIEKN